jgi:hypothetical protein
MPSKTTSCLMTIRKLNIWRTSGGCVLDGRTRLPSSDLCGRFESSAIRSYDQEPERPVRTMWINNLDELSKWFNESGPAPGSVDRIIITLNRKNQLTQARE